jgi:hemolysin activation/secretion protein
MTLQRFILLLALCGLHTAGFAFGMSPDGGAMMSHMEQGMAAHQSKQLEGLPVEFYPSMRWNEQFGIQVDAVVTQGNKRLPNDVLQNAVKVHLGKRIAVQRLSAITRLVEKAYRDAGYQAQAYVPEQSFARGTLIIQVIER